MPSEHSRSVRTTWLYTLASIVFFIGFYAAFVALLMLELFAASPDALIATIIGLQLVAGATQIRYCWFLRVGRGGGMPAGIWTAALFAPAVAVWVLGLFSAGAAFLAGTALWAACCLLACLLSRAWRYPTLGVAAVMFLGHAVLATTLTGTPWPFATSSGAWAIGLYSVVLPIMLLTSLWWWEIVVELDRHRRAAAQLAVAEERLRFASDLHDIQGHHLQVISLKAELAERLLPADPGGARDNIHEVRLIATQALQETRSLVAGYRQVALDDELQNAREVLSAAGARCALEVGELPSDATVRGALASVVREATTNILRHSEARIVSIRLGANGDGWVLEITNDGTHADAAAAAAGSGLVGLRERLAAVGGTLETDAAADRFAIRVSVPAPAAVLA